MTTLVLITVAIGIVHPPSARCLPSPEIGMARTHPLLVTQLERQAVADSLPRENRIHSIRETNGEHVVVVELAADQRRLDIGVYNLLGKRVATVYQGKATAGVREYGIPTVNLPNGIYICIVQGDGFRLAQKFVLSR